MAPRGRSIKPLHAFADPANVVEVLITKDGVAVDLQCRALVVSKCSINQVIAWVALIVNLKTLHSDQWTIYLGTSETHKSSGSCIL